MTKPVSEAVTTFKSLVKKDISIVKGVPAVEKDIYVKYLPESLPVEMVKAVHEYDSVFYPAVAEAFGEHCIDAMKKDKKLDVVTVEVPMFGKDHYDLTFKRQVTFPNPSNKDGEPIQKFGHMGFQVVTYAAKPNRGDMNAVRESLSAMAMEAFGK